MTLLGRSALEGSRGEREREPDREGGSDSV